MNFYAAQDSAHRRTFWLIALFVAAVLTLVAITNFLVLVVLAYSSTGVFPTTLPEILSAFDANMALAISAGIIVIVIIGSWYKVSMLSSGGAAIAESLGGNIIPQNSTDPLHRKILNVVEEMAIASGSPVPPVYLLDEMGINAFAAGWTPSSAVIGVTRGSVMYLSRDELQGVIAHEFSHIFNGDMRLNIRLMGVLHGILLLGLIGYYLMRAMRYMGGSRNRQGANVAVAVFALGLGLTIVGYCGTFFGQWIKAIVSRQREFLADATAVQYTRNRSGIAGALKKIGGLHQGSKLLSPTAPEYSHAYFSVGVNSVMNFMFATHPPLQQRVKRLLPNWDGKFITPQRDPNLEPVTRTDNPDTDSKHKKTAAVIAATTAVNEALNAIHNIGTLGDGEVQYAKQLLAELPDAIISEAEDPFAARAIIYCLLLHKDKSLYSQQLQHLQKHADKNVFEKTQKLQTDILNLPVKFRLPLIELCFPALRTLSLNQYRVFRANVIALIRTDKKIDVGEWIIKRLVLNKLDEVFGLRKPPASKFSYIGAIKDEVELVLSFIAYAEHQHDTDVVEAFSAAKKAIGAGALQIVPRDDISIIKLDKAMDKLEQFKPLLKPRILKAIVACIAHDGKISDVESELVRTIAISLDCPMPPILEQSN